MSKFDTHGGYFSPDNYIRINEGGTHDENANGGVQMGVDPEGVPNMVEEDETVYDDYVFSDNITVDDAMVEKHNLPVWAKGKLYSKVTDRLVEEAEERPMDPISNKGLQEMLSRLRDAQEEQKQLQQERELEDELSNLSPEELDQLEAMLAQGEQRMPVEQAPMGVAPEMVGPTEPVEQMPVGGMSMMRDGGYINKFAGGGLADFVKNVVNTYTNSRQGSSRRGRYAIDRSNYWGGRSARDIESATGYDDFTEYIIAHADDPAVLEYLRALDAGINTSTGARTLFGSNDQLNKGWEDLYRSRRKDGALGIYHLTPEDLSFMTQASPSFIPGLNLSWPYNSGNDWATFSRTSGGYFFPKYDLLTGEVTQYQPGMAVQQPQTLLTAPAGEPFALRGADPKDPLGIGERGTGRGILVDESMLQSDVNGTDPKVLAERERVRRARRERNSGNPVLSTIPRYSGALAAGALGLYNAAMPADEYTLPNVNPVLPQGQIHLRDPRYNPLDEEQMVNTVLAANSGTNRQIMNSGLGPSVGATLLASDYNAGRNIGTARQTVWNANNESRNAVTTAHNQNTSALANFDYGQSRDRAQILNDAAYRNRQNDMMRQRLNYMSEGEKYAAIQSSLDSVAQALSGIGQENAVLNATNSNRALYDWLSPNRTAAYKAATNEARDGGFLKKKTTVEKEAKRQMEELMKDAGVPTKEERREMKKRKIQKKIDDIWSPATPSEFKDLFSGRKKKKN